MIIMPLLACAPTSLLSSRPAVAAPATCRQTIPQAAVERLPVASRRQAALSLALLAASTPLSALAAAELTEEQNVIVEAWAAVQRGFVDQQFNGKDWKAIKSDYLKRKYKSMAEARGAVSFARHRG